MAVMSMSQTLDPDTSTLRRMFAESGPRARKEAFDLLCRRHPGAPEFEAAVLEAAWRDPVPEVRAAAVLAARFYPGEGALAAILEALKSDDARREATRVLRVSSRPDLGRRLLSELDAALAADDLPWGVAILRALSLRRDPEVAAKAVELLDSHGEDAAALVLGSGDPAALRVLASKVLSPDPGLMAKAVEAAFRLGSDEAFERLAPLLLAPERPTSGTMSRAREILSEARRWPDVRWAELALEIVEARAGARIGERVRALLGDAELPRGYPVEHLLVALGEFRHAPARAPLWAILEAGRMETYNLVATLFRLEGPEAYLPLLRASLPWLDAALANLFTSLATEPARVGELRGLLAVQPSNARLAGILAALERKFPEA